MAHWLITALAISSGLFIESSTLFASQPGTIPWMQPGSWIDYGPSTTVSCQSTVRYLTVDNTGAPLPQGQLAILRQDATTLRNEVTQFLQCGSSLGLVATTQYNSNPGDIFLAYDQPGAGNDGYIVESSGVLWASGDPQSSSGDGLFYGTRTLLQMIAGHMDKVTHTAIISGGGHGTIAGRIGRAPGLALDYPYFPERGMMVDVGRKIVQISTLKQLIREAAYVKLNFVQLHLADNGGFRLQILDPNYTQFQATDGYYTKSQINDLIAYAKIYHITIVPEIDMPGHCQWLTNVNPGWVLQTGPFYDARLCDLTNQQVRNTLKWFVSTYIDWFPSNLWFAGGDEWNWNTCPNQWPSLTNYAQQNGWGSARDVAIEFFNELDSIVRGRGKWMRAWADLYKWKGSLSGNTCSDSWGTVDLNKDIVLNVWDGSIDPNEILARGFNTLNVTGDRVYITPGVANSGLDPSMYSPTNQWTPFNWFGDGLGNFFASVVGSAGGDVGSGGNTTRVKGSYYCIWHDNLSADDNMILDETHGRLRIFAQDLWASQIPSDVEANQFQGWNMSSFVMPPLAPVDPNNSYATQESWGSLSEWIGWAPDGTVGPSVGGTSNVTTIKPFRNASYCLDVAGSGTTPGTPVGWYPCNSPTTANEQFWLDSSGYLHAYGASADLCVTTTSAPQNGAFLMIDSCANAVTWSWNPNDQTLAIVGTNEVLNVWAGLLDGWELARTYQYDIPDPSEQIYAGF